MERDSSVNKVRGAGLKAACISIGKRAAHLITAQY